MSVNMEMASVAAFRADGRERNATDSFPVFFASNLTRDEVFAFIIFY